MDGIGSAGRRRLRSRWRSEIERLEGRSLLSVGTVTLGDFDGDGKTDLAIYDQSSAAFYIKGSNPNDPSVFNGSTPIPLGNPNDRNVSAVGDYDGDGKADLAIYDQTTADFYIYTSTSGYSKLLGGGAIQLGSPNHLDVPVVGDFDGDGKADLGIYDETTADFYIYTSSSGYSKLLGGGPIQLGDPSHVNIPVSGDFDGDGKTDLAIYDETADDYYVYTSSSDFSKLLGGGPIQLGNPANVNVPVPGDFDGDGKTDLAIYDETTGAFYAYTSSSDFTKLLSGGPISMGSSAQTFLPVVGDVDGDGASDLLLYDENSASFYGQLSDNGFSTSLNGGRPLLVGVKTHANIPVNALDYDSGIGNFV